MQLFITATGTDIGKTYLSSIILSYFQKAERVFTACKPLMSGVNELKNCDAAKLLQAMNIKPTNVNIKAISPWIFSESLSPHRAAELNNKAINYNELLDWCKNWLKHNPNCLIEGAGGVAVPINYQHSNLDLMSDLQIPALLICSDYLGTISHTITALQTLHQRGIKVDAIIMNQSEQSTDHEGSKHSIKTFSPSDAPIFSFNRYSKADFKAWNDHEKWRKSDIYQNHVNFFAYLDNLS
jgi:dethiobiotin synthetase